MNVEFLWFDDCPNQREARQLLREALAEAGVDVEIDDLSLTDPELAATRRFPGSPTIRIDGIDVEPDFEDPGDYTPRCRLYATVPSDPRPQLLLLASLSSTRQERINHDLPAL